MQKKVRFPYFLFELTSKLEIPEKIKPTIKPLPVPCGSSVNINF